MYFPIHTYMYDIVCIIYTAVCETTSLTFWFCLFAPGDNQGWTAGGFGSVPGGGGGGGTPCNACCTTSRRRKWDFKKVEGAPLAAAVCARRVPLSPVVC